MNTQGLFDNFNSGNASQHQKVLNYIDTSPFQEGYWQNWKKLFKLTEQGLREIEDWDEPIAHQLLNLMTHFLIRLDHQEALSLQGRFPTKLTLRYMKRRGRRLMWHLAKNVPHLYRMTAERLILSHESAKVDEKLSMDYKNHWITLDVLLGKSRRSRQLGHGQGAYTFESKQYHLHYPEEGLAAVWDQEFDFLKRLLSKNMPWQIHEFAVKVLTRNQQTITRLSNQQLAWFFESPSLWLKRAAIRYIDAHVAHLTFSPELLATRWYYGNFKITNQVPLNNQPKFVERIAGFFGLTSATQINWYHQFKKALKDLVIKALGEGDTSKRIVRAIKFLQAERSFFISDQEAYDLAESLFKIDHPLTRKLAFKVAKKAQTYEAAHWLNAARHSEDHLQQLLAIYRNKISGTYRWGGYQEYAQYMFVEHPDVIDFGWEMAEKYLRVKEVANIWSRLLRSRKENALKLLRLNVQSRHAVKWFTASHANQMGHLYAYAPEKLAFMIEHGLPPIQDLLMNQIKHSFEFNPLIFLYLVTCLPTTQRQIIFDHGLPKLRNQDVLADILLDEHMLPHILQRIGTNDWGIKALLMIIAHSKPTLEGVKAVVAEVFKESFNTQLLMECLDQLLASANKSLFVEAIASEPLALLQHSQWVPRHFWLDFLNEIPSEHLDKFKQTFAQVVLTLGEEVLQVTHPVFEDLLLQWLSHHQQTIDLQSETLLKACIHRLPKIRQWGFVHADQLGLRATFALKLIESEVPDTVQFAQNYFHEILHQQETLADDLLMLCDSPVATTRDFGLELLQKVKISTEQKSQLLAYLSEHVDEKIQTYVSERLLQKQNTNNQAFIKEFDRAMLRKKNHNKTARENVKKRWSQQAEVEAATLMELAKTGNKRDAEWAIFQLTKLSLKGEKIDGFVLE